MKSSSTRVAYYKMYISQYNIIILYVHVIIVYSTFIVHNRVVHGIEFYNTKIFFNNVIITVFIIQ